MAIKLAIDFGTATTCMATVPDESTLRAEVIPIEENAPFSRTAVFIDRTNSVPLIRSGSSVGRHPLAVFGDAFHHFDTYWTMRRKARADGVAWSEWQQDRREEAMLLTYFKPELADNPARVPLLVPRVVWGSWDGLAQAQDFRILFEERSLAAPDPDTDDLVAATAAVLRSCVERALAKAPPGERISRLAIGIPSLSAVDSPFEYERSIQRRRAAVDIAGIQDEFGTSDFICQLFGEAEAAAWSVDIDSDEPTVYVIIIDVGAGTTDLALVEYGRERPGVYRVRQRVLADSVRFAGRNLNLALAQAFTINDQFRKGIAALDQADKRAWQQLMYSQVESVKCHLKDNLGQFQIDFTQASAAEFGTLEMDRIAHILRTSAYLSLSSGTQSVKDVVRKTLFNAWRPAVTSFIAQCIEHVKGKRHLLRIEKVGGAFRFVPLHAELINILQQLGLQTTSVQFRDEQLSAQTTVARGLAKWIAQSDV